MAVHRVDPRHAPGGKFHHCRSGCRKHLTLAHVPGISSADVTSVYACVGVAVGGSVVGVAVGGTGDSVAVGGIGVYVAVGAAGAAAGAPHPTNNSKMNIVPITFGENLFRFIFTPFIATKPPNMNLVEIFNPIFCNQDKIKVSIPSLVYRGFS